MGRVFGILAIVLGVWFAAQLYLRSAQHATHAALPPQAELGAEPSGHGRTLPQAAGDRVRAALQQGTAKLEHALPPDE